MKQSLTGGGPLFVLQDNNLKTQDQCHCIYCAYAPVVFLLFKFQIWNNTENWNVFFIEINIKSFRNRSGSIFIVFVYH